MSRRTPASLPCPQCGHERTNLVTLRGRPIRHRDRVLRGHECPECAHRFVSIQRPATDDELYEAAVEAIA